MKSDRIGVAGYLGLAVIVAVNLALFRGAMVLLTIPFVVVLLILLDLSLARLLILRSPLRASEYGFIAVGIVATMLSLPFNNDPAILQTMIRLYREVTGDFRVFRFNTSPSFIYAERAVVGLAILAVSLLGGFLAGWLARRVGYRQPADFP
jgi:hypothetical protein